jgi:drug/metabolite transporter (DMT)-like permease
VSAPLPRLVDYLLLVVLAALWGGSFMLMKVAIDTVPPATMTTVRALIAALLYAVFIVATGRRLPAEPRVWATAALAGLFGIALPFSLIAWGEERIDSGLAAILMAGMPLVTLVLARFVSGNEPMTAAKVVGVAFGIVGLVVLIGPGKLAALGDDVVRQLAVVAASVCYAVNAVVQKRIADQDPYAISAAIMISASAMLLPVSLVLEAPWTLAPTGEAWIALLLLGIFPTGLASLLMLAILRRQGAGFFANVNFLVPLFGVAWGFVILSERPPASALAALVLILAGVAISRGRWRPRQTLCAETIK